MLADGHDVDPVDLFRPMFQARLDAAYQCLDLGAAQAAVADVIRRAGPAVTGAVR